VIRAVHIVSIGVAIGTSSYLFASLGWQGTLAFVLSALSALGYCWEEIRA
jgi:hypothetical protein